jgi:hypothetical protein
MEHTITCVARRSKYKVIYTSIQIKRVTLKVFTEIVKYENKFWSIKLQVSFLWLRKEPWNVNESYTHEQGTVLEARGQICCLVISYPVSGSARQECGDVMHM